MKARGWLILHEVPFEDLHRGLKQNTQYLLWTELTAHLRFQTVRALWHDLMPIKSWLYGPCKKHILVEYPNCITYHKRSSRSAEFAISLYSVREDARRNARLA
jgi:hypothetical protein